MRCGGERRYRGGEFPGNKPRPYTPVMNTENALLAVACAALLCACAATSAVTPAATSASGFEGAVFSGETVQLDKPTPGAEVYRVFQQGATGFVSVASVREGVEDIATKHCERKGKAVRPIHETASKPPHILGNFPRVEWLFECADPLPIRPTQTNGANHKIDQLERLKKLLDSGALTQQEFDREKAKLLGN